MIMAKLKSSSSSFPPTFWTNIGIIPPILSLFSMGEKTHLWTIASCRKFPRLSSVLRGRFDTTEKLPKTRQWREATIFGNFLMDIVPRSPDMDSFKVTSHHRVCRMKGVLGLVLNGKFGRRFKVFHWMCVRKPSKPELSLKNGIKMSIPSEKIHIVPWCQVEIHQAWIS